MYIYSVHVPSIRTVSSWDNEKSSPQSEVLPGCADGPRWLVLRDFDVVAGRPPSRLVEGSSRAEHIDCVQDEEEVRREADPERCHLAASQKSFSGVTFSLSWRPLLRVSDSVRYHLMYILSDTGEREFCIGTQIGEISVKHERAGMNTSRMTLESRAPGLVRVS